jgi:thioredoxin
MRIRTLFSSFFLTSFILMACNSDAQKSNLSVEEFEKVINTQKVQLLDVRTASEYENGHLKNALQADWTNEQQFKQRVKSLDKKIPIYTYCLSGGRSGAAMQWLNENGYTAYNMEGGLKSWNNAGKPLEQKMQVEQMSMEAYLKQIPTDKTVLVDFGAEWCPPCKKLEPILKELQQSYGDKLVLLKIDGGSQTSIVKEMNIEEFPTLIIYKAGKPVWKKQGFVEKQEITSQL